MRTFVFHLSLLLALLLNGLARSDALSVPTPGSRNASELKAAFDAPSLNDSRRTLPGADGKKDDNEERRGIHSLDSYTGLVAELPTATMNVEHVLGIPQAAGSMKKLIQTIYSTLRIRRYRSRSKKKMELYRVLIGSQLREDEVFQQILASGFLPHFYMSMIKTRLNNPFTSLPKHRRYSHSVQDFRHLVVFIDYCLGRLDVLGSGPGRQLLRGDATLLQVKDLEAYKKELMKLQMDASFYARKYNQVM